MKLKPLYRISLSMPVRLFFVRCSTARDGFSFVVRTAVDWLLGRIGMFYYFVLRFCVPDRIGGLDDNFHDLKMYIISVFL